jgi:hypothetical protein
MFFNKEKAIDRHFLDDILLRTLPCKGKSRYIIKCEKIFWTENQRDFPVKNREKLAYDRVKVIDA